MRFAIRRILLVRDRMSRRRTVVDRRGEVRVGLVPSLGLNLILNLFEVLPHLPDVVVWQHHGMPANDLLHDRII
jgi:hypothetical protein